MTDYTIQLDRVFQGPMDLLLHLVREQEVEIHEVQIHRIVDGFVAYVNALENLDLEFVGDFVVMAATLMAIKSRSLLPRTEVDLDEELDPGDELIQRLIEYRRYKVLSEALGQKMDEREQIRPRGWRGEVREHQAETLLDLGELTAFDLMAAYSRLMRETQRDRPHQISTDPRPLRFYVDRVVDRVQSLGRTSLRGLLDELEDGPTREGIVGSFCALLELCRLGVIRVEQPEPGQDIDIRLEEQDPDAVRAAMEGLRLEEEEEEEERAGESTNGDPRGGEVESSEPGGLEPVADP